MSSAEISLLSERFGIAEQLRFTRGEGGLTFIEVLTEQAGARIALQGAQLIHWAPAGEAPVIWLSQQARYARGSSLRGGVPVCWPWFGPHATQADYPAHGFARTAPWDVMATRLDDDGRIGIRLQLPVLAMRDDIWPHAARLELAITVGTALEMELQTCNAGNETIVISEALHTYFQVSDIRKVEVSGLEDCEYQDKVGESVSKLQSGRIRFTQETDRVYLHTTADCCIHDPGLKRQIHIRKRGSHSTVIWNPWVDKAARMGDLGDEGYLHMLCVESANALEDVVRLAPGAEHRLRVRYEVHSSA